MIIVLYNGQEVDLPSTEGVLHLSKCRSPFCNRVIQTRPSGKASGRPKEFCSKRCRAKWQRRRNLERKYFMHIQRMEALH